MKQYKVVVTVPESDGDALRKAVGDVGGGKVGNYSHCSFTVKGAGRFIPQDGARPTIGTVGEPEEVTEERIEVNCDETSLGPVLKTIRENHPYEEPAVDVYPLLEL
ncbi:MAG TPA: hypothetical protein VGM08_02905 [Candidatus Saccharimonadales bacterium]|jgi:hypothetical protein